MSEKTGSLVRLSVDVDGYVCIIIGGCFTFQLVTKRTKKKTDEGEVKAVQLKSWRSFLRLVSVLRNAFAVPVHPTTNEEWEVKSHLKENEDAVSDDSSDS